VALVTRKFKVIQRFLQNNPWDKKYVTATNCFQLCQESRQWQDQNLLTLHHNQQLGLCTILKVEVLPRHYHDYHHSNNNGNNWTSFLPRWATEVGDIIRKKCSHISGYFHFIRYAVFHANYCAIFLSRTGWRCKCHGENQIGSFINTSLWKHLSVEHNHRLTTQLIKKESRLFFVVVIPHL
jgi:hypothetical protein